MKKNKLKKALELGARAVEKSISKIAWDLGNEKIKVVSGKLDYLTYQIIDAVADNIAQKPWIAHALGLRDADDPNEPDRLLTVLTCSQIKSFLENQNISNKKIKEIALRLPLLVFDGKAKIPIAGENGEWKLINLTYRDNFCGVAIANQEKEFSKYRSGKKLRGKGSDIEEPVFIFLFTNAYGKTFFRNAMRRNGCQLQNPELYKLNPKAQELFQSIRWKGTGDDIELGIETISRMMNLKWPPHKMRERANRIRKILAILWMEGFITKPFERGGFAKDKVWWFRINKKYLLPKRRN